MIGRTTKFFPYISCCTAWILGCLVVFLDRRQEICLHTFATKFLPWGILSFHKQFSLSCGQQESLSYICVHCTLQQVHWLQILHRISWSKQWLKKRQWLSKQKTGSVFQVTLAPMCPSFSYVFNRRIPWCCLVSHFSSATLPCSKPIYAFWLDQLMQHFCTVF